MANRLEKFIADITKSGLATRERIDPEAAAIADPASEAAPQELADRLIRAGVLTPYQAKKLLAGATRGFLLANYKILDQIGQGGASKVFLAEHRTTREIFAVKVLPPQAAALQERLLARFHREMRLSRRIEHKNVARAADVGVAGGVCYIVMEYIEGVNLYEYVKRSPGKPLGFAEASRIFLQVADGLEAIHDAGLIHRDIKPSNIILGTDGRPRILDLGLSLVIGEPEEARPIPKDSLAPRTTPVPSRRTTPRESILARISTAWVARSTSPSRAEPRSREETSSIRFTNIAWKNRGKSNRSSRGFLSASPKSSANSWPKIPAGDTRISKSSKTT